MNFNKLISELKRRNVIKATVAYLAVAWVIIQIVSILLPVFNAPDDALKVIFYLLIIGLVVWIVLSWIYDLTEEGLKKTKEFVDKEESLILTSQRLNKVIITSLIIVIALLVVNQLVIFNGLPAKASFNKYTTIVPLTSFEGIELNPSWSPDGSQIVFQSSLAGNADIYTMTKEGGAAHNITGTPFDEWSPSWSPDGIRISYLSDRGTGTTIFFVPSSGGAERKIENTNIPISKLGTAISSLGGMPWSPDSHELVFSRNKDDGTTQLWIYNIQDGRKRVITHPLPGSRDLSGSWSHDGSRIIFTRESEGKQSVISFSVSNGNEEVIIQDEFFYRRPVWSPDNQFILFTSNRSGASNIWEYDLESETFNQVTFGKGSDASPVYAKNGEIVYSNWHHTINIYQGNINDPIHDHTQLTSHTKDDFYPRVSPDDTKIVYQSNRTGNEEIWLFDLNQQAEIQLTKNSNIDRVPSWSKSGKEIVFVSDRNGVFQLWQMSVDGKDEMQLIEEIIDMPDIPQNASNASPRHSPDGSLIGFVVKNLESPTLWVVQADGRNAVSTEIDGIISFDWYKDSHHIIYSKKADKNSDSTPMYIRSISSGKELLLVEDVVTEICVSPTYEKVSYCSSKSHFGQTLNIIDLDYDVVSEKLTSPVKRPIVFLSGKGKWHPHNGGWTPDGKHILYSKDTDEGDLYILKPRK